MSNATVSQQLTEAQLDKAAELLTNLDLEQVFGIRLHSPELVVALARALYNVPANAPQASEHHLESISNSLESIALSLKKRVVVI